MSDATKTLSSKDCNESERNIFVGQLQDRIKETIRLMVDDPDDIRVTVSQDDKTTIFIVECGKHNIGKILGKGGKNITALRTLTQAISSNFGFRAVIEIPYYPS